MEMHIYNGASMAMGKIPKYIRITFWLFFVWEISQVSEAQPRSPRDRDAPLDLPPHAPAAPVAQAIFLPHALTLGTPAEISDSFVLIADIAFKFRVA